MAVILRETPNSRTSQENPRAVTLYYTLRGVIDDAYARWYVRAATAGVYDELYRQDILLDPKGNALWNVEVPYGPIEPKESGEFSLAFDTTGGTAHITQAKSHIQSYIPAGTAPDHQGAIGVTSHGVEGTDIVVPQFSWTEDWTLPIAYVEFSYGVILKAITGRVNAAPFRGFGTGQVRFDGATGRASSRDPDLAELTYHFTQSDDSADAMPNFMAGIVKLGWQYLWVEHQPAADPTAVQIVQPPLAVHVEGVYDSADFSLLAIGTGV